MVALKKEGMTTRHWKAISEEIGGEPINPDLDEDFCFGTCLKKGLLEHAEFWLKQGDTAYKENGIRKLLDEMKEAWKRESWPGRL